MLSKDIKLILEEAVTDSLAEDLGMSGARTIAKRMGVSTFESPRKASEVLDSVFDEGSEALKQDIAERFRLGVYLPVEKMKRTYVQAPKVPTYPKVRLE
jgi:hypothetical protein